MDELKAFRAIRGAGIIGLILTAIIIMGFFIIPGINQLEGLVVLFIIFSLTYGTFAKSRVCSSLLLGCYLVYVFNIVNYALMFGMKTHIYIIFLLFFVAGYFLIQGVRGTFIYHTLNKEKTVV